MDSSLFYYEELVNLREIHHWKGAGKLDVWSIGHRRPGSIYPNAFRERYLGMAV